MCLLSIKHHIKPREIPRKQKVCYIILRTCMSGAQPSPPPLSGRRDARWNIDAICHARLKVFHEMVEKETEMETTSSS